MFYAIVPNDIKDAENHCMMDTLGDTEKEAWEAFENFYSKNDNGIFTVKRVRVVIEVINQH